MTRQPAATTILVVDDERSNREVISQILRRCGYTVVAVASGEAAINLAAVSHFDVILLDVQMPGLSGFEVCRRLKKEPHTRLTPIVLVTGLHARQHKIKGIKVGADDFLSKPFDTEELVARVGALVRLKQSIDELETAEAFIASLAQTIEARDPYTEGHCQNVATFATGLGTRLGLSAAEIDSLWRGGYLHDIGKVGIPDAVLLKPARLDDREYEMVRQHSIIGARLCEGLRSLHTIRTIVRHHHERRDGSGYPDGLRGDDIPLLVQIVSIADVYDAITNTRPYRKASSPQEAFEELAQEASRGLHREELVREFIALGQSGGLTPRQGARPLA